MFKDKDFTPVVLGGVWNCTVEAEGSYPLSALAVARTSVCSWILSQPLLSHPKNCIQYENVDIFPSK